MPGLYDIIGDRISYWAEGNYIRTGRTMGFLNFFVSFGIPKIIVVDADRLFSGMFNKTFQHTLLIPVHDVARVNDKAIINRGFLKYFNKLQKINSSYKVSLHQWFQGVFFALYACNSGPVYSSEIA